MPTKLYFRAINSTVSGTLPSTEQGAATAAIGMPTGANESLDTAPGSAMIQRAFNTSASTAAQTAYLGRFVSKPLASAQTVGGGTVTLNVADSESNAAANFWVNSLNIYVWRPSTGTKVGTVRDNSNSAGLGGTEGTTSATVTRITGITTSAVSAAAGDVVVVELWARFTQSMATQYTARWHFDGATENTTENAAVTDHAAFIQLAETLTFEGPTGPVSKVWTGSAWTTAVPKVWTGSAWTPAAVGIWNGTDWTG